MVDVSSKPLGDGDGKAKDIDLEDDSDVYGDCIEQLQVLLTELQEYKGGLLLQPSAKRQFLVIANKIDRVSDASLLRRRLRRLKQFRWPVVSAVPESGDGQQPAATELQYLSFDVFPVSATEKIGIDLLHLKLRMLAFPSKAAASS